MQRFIILTFIVFFIMPLHSCVKEDDENVYTPGADPGAGDPAQDDQLDYSNIDLEKSIHDLVEADNSFGMELFKNVSAIEHPDSNLFISPVSVGMALAMTYNGAAGQTREDMQDALSLGRLDTNHINPAYKKLMDDLVNTDPDVLLSIANSIWYREGFKVKQPFLDVNKSYYNARVDSLNFADPAAVDTINNWVAKHTNDKIEKIIDQISSEIVMCLINAIYFKGTWKYIFDEENTVDRTFYLSDSTELSVAFMYIEEEFEYAAFNECGALKIPYGNEDYAMIILLPGEDYTVHDLTALMGDEYWNKWQNGLARKDVNIYLPKFKFSYEKKLNQVLKDMGMEIAFSKSMADFSGINDSLKLYIDEVKHKTFVEVNEEGTEAAAVTSVIIDNTSVGDHVIFDANKPFLFAIVEQNTNAIVFMGRMMEPVY